MMTLLARQALFLRRLMPAAMLWLLVGCAAGPDAVGPAYLTLPPDQYQAAFEAAIEAARVRGMTGGLRDRRAGIIQTDPKFAPSVLEPWDPAVSTAQRSLESTLAFQRVQARFEFTPVGLAAMSEHGGAPDTLALGSPLRDLTQADTVKNGVELRVWVYVEQARRPSVRRSTWSRRETTNMVIIEHGPDGPTQVTNSWTPMSRDEYLERQLLAAVAKAIAPTEAAN
ncbi:MAG TPA: hypothetical protein PK400_13145 [Phycisphaerales bacterium]|nr:hypothetical protein [Phycisphaerales bacterium]HRQ75508.1 hypothetical protein [Phycisphaerales bacterium]